MTPRVLNFISYPSPLAQSQTQALIDHIETHLEGVRCQLDIVADPVLNDGSDGDDDGVFVALNYDQVQHCQQLVSAKPGQLVVVEAADLTMPLPEDLAIVCVPARTPPYDAYLNRDDQLMDEMEPGSTIGVMSLRLRSQMSALWPDLKFEILQGGIDKAMATHLQSTKLNGLVLPAAVTEHLGIQGIVAEIYTPEFMLPSAGQGILVIVGHRDDKNSVALLADLHSNDTAIEFATEKAFCSRMISDQDLPVGILAKVVGKQVIITGATGSGEQRIEISGHTSEAEAVGSGLAHQLLSSGASFMDLLEAEFPDGLPDEPGDDENDKHIDEDAAILDQIDEDEDESLVEDDFDDLEHMRALEDMAGIEDKPENDGEESEDEFYD